MRPLALPCMGVSTRPEAGSVRTASLIVVAVAGRAAAVETPSPGVRVSGVFTVATGGGRS